MRRFAAGIVFVAALFVATSAHAQLPQAAGPPSPPDLLRVFLACEGCDAALKADAPFVRYVDDPAQAAVEVRVTPGPIDAAERTWVIAFTGREAFSGQDRRLTLKLPGPATAEDIRAGLARVYRIGLAEYALKSEAGSQLDVTVRPGGNPAADVAALVTADPWNHWVFRLSANLNQSGEVSSANGNYGGGASASRVTEAWKIDISTYRNVDTNRFVLSDTETIETEQRNWSFESLTVKSLDAHWSAGVTASAGSSTYSNQHLVLGVYPAIEYDVYPYSESSQRSITLQYAIGAARFEYLEPTIYDKTEEIKPRHTLSASLGFRQPWGNAGASVSVAQILNMPEQNRVSVSGNISVRLRKGLSVNGSAGYSRIRDQFYLPKSGATEQEILLRLRQLETGYSAYASFGVSYSFGSLSNATVNPRFGG